MALLEWQPVDLRGDPEEARYVGDPGELIDAAGFVAELLLHRPAWHALAACRGQGPARWFPGQGEPLGAAREVCAGCPVAVDCLAAALEVVNGDEFGVWAGTSARQRRQLRRTIAEAAA